MQLARLDQILRDKKRIINNLTECLQSSKDDSNLNLPSSKFETFNQAQSLAKHSGDAFSPE